MDPDSYLNLLSPDFNEFDDWFSGSQPELSIAATSAGINDEQTPMNVEPAVVCVPRSTIAPFTSVLKLSDIACALEEFSKTSLCPVSLNNIAAQATQKLPLMGAQLQQPPPPPNSNCHIHGHGPGQSVKRNLLQAVVDGDYKNGPEDNDEIRERAKPNLAMATSLALPFPSLSKQSSSPEKRPKISQSSKSALTKADNPDLSRKLINKEGLSQREVHIQSERLRRKSMSDYFTLLQSLVPRLKLKHTDRITVLTEVIAYIQSLRGTLEELDQKKTELLTILGLTEEDYYYSSQKYVISDCIKHHNVKRNPTTINDDKLSDSHAEVTVRISGVDVFVTLNTPKQKGVWSKVLLLLQRYSIEVVNATLATSGENNFHCIHGKVVNISKVGSSDLQEKLEELIFKELNRRPRL